MHFWRTGPSQRHAHKGVYNEEGELTAHIEKFSRKNVEKHTKGTRQRTEHKLPKEQLGAARRDG